MPLEIKSRGIEEIVVSCSLNSNDRIIIVRSDDNEEVNFGLSANSDVVVLSNKDAISLAEAILSMMEEE